MFLKFRTNSVQIPTITHFLRSYSLSESNKNTLDLEPFGSGKWEANHLKEFNHDTAFVCTVVNVKFRYVQRS